ncbi:hypothetical protein L596_028644 [Steinernema carpocapsae]|uniref:G-protein coupled receptors family 1 profile domain-containing protein n=1 Tax=Steinernema carpocapsae TaxID=34508 RepID=A0A4U5LYZ9_STECR|nr:hypothetical protein L596_028644 [Steinernema carpocapsae]
MASIVSDLAFGWMLLVVTADRFFAVFAPIRYFTMTYSYVWKMHLIVLFKSLLCLCIAFIFTKNLVLPEVSSLCYTSDSVNEKIDVAFALVRIVAVSMSIILYVPICWRLYTMAKQKHLGRYSTRRYAQLKSMTITVALSSTAGILCVLMPDTIVAFDLFGLKQFSSYFFILILAKSVTNVAIYVFRNPVLSQRMQKIICRRKNLETRVIHTLSRVVSFVNKRKSSSTLSVHQQASKQS